MMIALAVARLRPVARRASLYRLQTRDRGANSVLIEHVLHQGDILLCALADREVGSPPALERPGFPVPLNGALYAIFRLAVFWVKFAIFTVPRPVLDVCLFDNGDLCLSVRPSSASGWPEARWPPGLAPSLPTQEFTPFGLYRSQFARGCVRSG